MKPFHVILRHPGRTCVLMREVGGQWRLPRVHHEGGWLAYNVDELAREMSRLTGLEVTFLRELGDRRLSVCEMEYQGRPDRLPPKYRWVGADDLRSVSPVLETQRAVLKDWFKEPDEGRVPRRRARWERRGWWAAATAWIARRLRERGIRRTGRLIQYKAAWSWSCIIQVPTDAGELFFKAGYAKQPAESQVLNLLAKRWPGSIPSILATGRGLRGVLMRDFGGRSLDELPSARWAGAVRHFAEVQLSYAGEVKRLRAIGCPDRTPDRLIARYRWMLADRGRLTDGRSSGLASSTVSRLRKQTSIFREWCRELDGYAIPPSIVNEDFRAENIRALPDRYIFFDWTDTVVAHPFFSMARFLDFVRSQGGSVGAAGVRMERFLRDAYLEPWAAYGTVSQLRKAFDIVQKLSPLYLAVRWDCERRFLEPTSPWGRYNAQAALRNLRDCIPA